MSTNSSEQNGRQPPLPNQPPPSSSDPWTANLPEICRNYVWGTCTKGIHCRFRHERDIEEMKTILKFCHNFQNKGCTGKDCTYLHASEKEETSFRTTGKLPRVLEERYAALSETSNTMPNFEGVPQMMFVMAPPPPPSLPAPLLLAATAPPPPPPLPQPASVFPTIQQPPPPPPPTAPPTSIVQTPPAYTGSSVHNPPGFPLTQPPASPTAKFDPSRPPPPLPGQIKNGTLKRRIECEAGPSKARRPEGPKVAENACEYCVQRELRLDVYKKKIDKMRTQLKYQSSVYKKNMLVFKSAREILRAVVNQDMYPILEEYIEGGPPQLQISTNPFLALIPYLIGNSRNVVESSLISSPTRSPTAFSRLDSPVNHSSSDLQDTFIDFLRNFATSESRSEAVSSGNSNNNGYNQLTNGQKSENTSPASIVPSNRYSASVSAARPAASGAAPQPALPAPALPAPALPAPAPAPVPTTAAALAPPHTASVYMPYHPGIPPPINRPYYHQSYSDPSSSMNMVFPPRAGPPMSSQMQARPSSSAAPTMPPNFNAYMMGRYPHPPQYFPPYQ